MRLYVTVDVEHSGLYRSMAQWLSDSGALDASACYKALPKWSGALDAEVTQFGKGGGKGRGSLPTSAKSYSLTPRDVDVCFLPLGDQKTYRITFEGRPVWIGLTTEGEIGPKMRRRPGLDQDRIRIQALNFAFGGRDLIRRLLVVVQTAAMRASENKLDLWHCVRTKSDMEWEIAATITKRPSSTVVLDQGIMKDILSDVTKFINREAWYSARNIPHRRGYLLEGPPGCGKTSLVRAVASEFNLPLCCVQLKSSRVGEAGIEALLQKAPEGGIIFIEDIDCAEQGGVSSRRSHEDDDVSKGCVGGTDTERVTMSELLNAIDGLGAQTGRLLFLTTNHLERLDEALVRDGRIDRRFHIGLATRCMTKRIFLSICADDPPSAAEVAQAEAFAQALPEGFSMAEIQGFLIKHHEKTFDEMMTIARGLGGAKGERDAHAEKQNALVEADGKERNFEEASNDRSEITAEDDAVCIKNALQLVTQAPAEIFPETEQGNPSVKQELDWQSFEFDEELKGKGGKGKRAGKGGGKAKTKRLGDAHEAWSFGENASEPKRAERSSK